ncbi:MAG: dihydrofolate reductase [bacterium]|nr:MAG: dihydrofolate reductase [bacterium]
MRISIIAAMSSNYVIGINNTLPWKLSEDLKHFKELTLGKSLIMGRKTFDSIGRPLPGREIIVVTRQENYSQIGVKVAYSLKEAIKIAQQEEVFIAGGAQIYQQSLDLADTFYLTLIEKDFIGDVYFPKWNNQAWQMDNEESYYSPTARLSYKFQTYKKSYLLIDS